MSCTTTMVGDHRGNRRHPVPVLCRHLRLRVRPTGAWIGTANLIGIYDILNFLQIWPNFLLPIQAQIPSHAVFIWALCTVYRGR